MIIIANIFLYGNKLAFFVKTMAHIRQPMWFTISEKTSQGARSFVVHMCTERLIEAITITVLSHRNFQFLQPCKTICCFAHFSKEVTESSYSHCSFLCFV